MLISSTAHLSGSLFLPHFRGIGGNKYESNSSKKCVQRKNFAIFTTYLVNFNENWPERVQFWAKFPYFLWKIFRSRAYFFSTFEKCLFLPGGGEEYLPLPSIHDVFYIHKLGHAQNFFLLKYFSYIICVWHINCPRPDYLKTTLMGLYLLNDIS